MKIVHTVVVAWCMALLMGAGARAAGAPTTAADPQLDAPLLAGSADLLVDYGTKSAVCNVTGTNFKEGDWVMGLNALEDYSVVLPGGHMRARSVRLDDWIGPEASPIKRAKAR